MSEIHALSGAYAVDALDDVERAQFERHLKTCEACCHEVDSLRETAALLTEPTLAAPPAGLRNRVLAQVATVRPLPPVVTTSTDDRRRRRWLPILLAAAAALVLAIGVGLGYAAITGDDSDLTAVEQVLQAEDAQTFTNTLPGGVDATLVRSESLDRAVLVAEEMPQAPSGQEYALWLQQDGVMEPAGIMPADAVTHVLLEGDAAGATGAGVTLEEADTVPQTPSEDVVALFEFET